MAEHNELGEWGEAIARDYLVKKGYSILEQNWHAGHAEADIIASIGNELVIVEVKTRMTEFFGMPETFVENKKQQQLADVAEAYCLQYPDNNWDLRYDIIAILVEKGEPEITHFEDAFFPDNLGLRTQYF